MFKRNFLLVAAFLCMPLGAFGITEDSVQVDFFNRFNDENLSKYVIEAYTNNHSLKQAAARVDEYRGQMKYQFGSELPSLSVSANYTGINTPKMNGYDISENAFALPFIASYEADFLLKNRDKTRAAKKAFEAEELNEKTAYIALLTDVGTVYTNILQYDKLVSNQTEIVKLSNEIFERDKRKFERGVIDITTLNNSQKQLEDIKNTLENYTSKRDTLLMQLAILTANPPQTPISRGNIDNFEYIGQIPDEITSEVIFARPDVLATEKQLEGARINVRVARKEFLPTFNITGIWAFNTLASGTFFSWESSLAMLIAGATQDIFAGGKKVANLKIQKAKYEQIFENYREVDLEAAKEVNTALCVIKHKTKENDNSKTKLEKENKNFESANQKFNNGVISKNELLESQIKLLAQENETINTKAERIVNYFTLYKAVGGQL